MPQLMPLSWFMSTIMVMLLLLMMIKVYYMMNYNVNIMNVNFYKKAFIWLW